MSEIWLIIQGFLPDIIGIVITILSAIIVYFIAKYLKVTIDKSQIENILHYLVGLIIEIEQRSEKRLTGEEKFEQVYLRASQELKKEDLTLLEKTMGGLKGAIEFAFQTYVQPNLIGKALSKLGIIRKS